MARTHGKRKGKTNHQQHVCLPEHLIDREPLLLLCFPSRGPSSRQLVEQVWARLRGLGDAQKDQQGHERRAHHQGELQGSLAELGRHQKRAQAAVGGVRRGHWTVLAMGMTNKINSQLFVGWLVQLLLSKYSSSLY